MEFSEVLAKLTYNDNILISILAINLDIITGRNTKLRTVSQKLHTRNNRQLAANVFNNNSNWYDNKCVVSYQ